MSPQDTCAFCGLSEETKDTGKLQNTLDGSIVAHYNCMLYSPRVTQIDSQEDTEGFGFNTDLVNSEINRGRKLPCSLCKQRGATVGCFVESCKKTYHYPCLIKAKGRPIPDKFIVYCDRHKPSSTPKDSWRLQTTKKRKRLQKATSRPRNSNIRNRRDNDDSKRWQCQPPSDSIMSPWLPVSPNEGSKKDFMRARKRTKLQNTAGRSRKNDIRNQYAYNVDPHPAMQNVQSDDQQETTLLLAIDSAEIEDSEEALPSTSGQPMSSGTNSEESDSILNPKVKDTFSLCGFPKRKMKHISNRKPSKKLQEILQKITPQEKKDLSQIYSELGGSESYRTIEMDVTSDNQTGEITTDNPMITDDTETSTCSDNYDGDKTPERLPEINEHGIPSRYSSDDKHFTEEQTVSSQDEKIDRVSKSSYKRKKNLDIVISRLSSTLFSDSDILDRSGTLAGQLSNFVPQIQRTIKSREQNGDGQAISKGSRKPNTNDQPVPREVLELRRLRSSEGWIENGKRIRRLLSVKTSPAENNLGEPLRNQETSDDAIRKKESITSKRKRFQDSDEVLSNMSPQRTEDSLLEETETPGSEVNEPAPGHHSGPSQRITPFRRRLNRRFPRDVSQSSFQHKRVEDLDDMDGFSIAVAGQCRTMQEDRQAIYMSYVLASANLFRGYAILPNVEVLIGNLRNELDRFQQSSSCGAYGSSD
ncbi:PHD finger protein 11 isoform X5 [Dendrobates tinctorius]|uniref:PHD finger protein 11 isoform X5 n=1 Tax=Dendrobates tinctorius TaxID=92724 RepID=UPI003CCA5DB4